MKSRSNINRGRRRSGGRHDAGVGGAIGGQILSFEQLCVPLSVVRRARGRLGMGALALNNVGHIFGYILVEVKETFAPQVFFPNQEGPAAGG